MWPRRVRHRHRRAGVAIGRRNRYVLTRAYRYRTARAGQHVDAAAAAVVVQQVKSGGAAGVHGTHAAVHIYYTHTAGRRARGGATRRGGGRPVNAHRTCVRRTPAGHRDTAVYQWCVAAGPRISCCITSVRARVHNNRNDHDQYKNNDNIVVIILPRC